MSDAPQDVVIPDRPTFKAAEVCELLKLQAYVLRSWENEFQDLGVSRTAGAPRVYRRSDVELALRIRQLVFGEGLTLAGVRRRLEQERPAPPEEEAFTAPAPPVDPRTRERIEQARQGLRSVLALLDARPAGAATTSRPATPVRKATLTRPGPPDTPEGDLFSTPETRPAVAEPAAEPTRRPRRRK